MDFLTPNPNFKIFLSCTRANKLGLALVLLGALFILNACQHYSKKSCEETNWRKEAFLFALGGEDPDIYNKIAKKCKALKVDVDKQVFREGFDEGATQFCSSASALEYGQGGYPYKGTCKNLNEKEYMKTYTKGRLIFLSSQYKKVSAQLEESNSRLWRKRNEYELEANTSPTLASRAYDELESYKAENERIKSDLESLQSMIKDLQKESVKD